MAQWKGELVSLLEVLAPKLGLMTFEEARGEILKVVNASRIKDEAKRRIAYNLGKQTEMAGLQKYIYNAILFYEGMAVGGYRNRW